MIITPRPGHTLTTLEAASRRDHRAAEEGRTDRRGDSEGDRRRGAGFVSGLESNLGKAFQLADGAGYHGDPGYFRTDYQKTLSVTADDVKRVANKYLTGGRVVLSVVPAGKLDQAAKPDQSKRVTDYDAKKPEGGK